MDTKKAGATDCQSRISRLSHAHVFRNDNAETHAEYIYTLPKYARNPFGVPTYLDEVYSYTS